MAIKAVIFDLGDTLLNFGRVRVNKLLGEGARLTYDYLATLEGAEGLPGFEEYRRHNTRAIKKHYVWSRLIQREFDCVGLLRKDTEKMGFSLSKSEMEWLTWLWYKPLADSAVLEDDLVEALEKLERMGLKLGVLSNTFVPASAHDYHLEQLGLLRFFPVRVYSSDTVFRKPDRRIFRRVLEQLEFAASEVAMVGDRWIFDIYGARKMGMLPIYKHCELNRYKRRFVGCERIDRIRDLAVRLKNRTTNSH